MSDWARTIIPVPRDARGPIGVQAIPTISLAASVDAGLTRVGLRQDGIEVATFTLPGIPAGARITVDGRTATTSGLHDGTDRPLPGFATGDVRALSRLDLTRGEWELTVDQVPGAEVVLDVEVSITPIGQR